MTPDLQALITIWGLLIRNIGAQITGTFMRVFIAEIWAVIGAVDVMGVPFCDSISYGPAG